MAQTSLSSIPATPEQLADLQNTGVLEGLISPDGGLTWNPEYIESATDVSTYMSKTQTPVSKYIKTVTASAADPVNNIINEIDPTNADDKFDFAIGTIHKIIGSTGLYVVDNTMATIQVDVANFIAANAGSPVLNESLDTIINEHYKTRIAALNPVTAGVERQLSIMFMSSAIVGLTSINVVVRQINAASSGATGNTAVVTSIFNGPSGFGSPLTIEDIDVAVVSDGASGLMANVTVSYSV